jgi:hypothetical protein
MAGRPPTADVARSHGLEPRSGPLVCGRNPAHGARVQWRVPNVDRIGDQQPTLATILHTVCSSKTLHGQCAGVGVDHYADLATAAAAPDDDGECAREVRPCSRTVAEPRSIGSAITGTIKENWSHPACEHLGAWIVREIRQSCLLNRRQRLVLASANSAGLLRLSARRTKESTLV